MLSVKELTEKFPPDHLLNLDSIDSNTIDFITHRKEYLDNQSAYVVFKNQDVKFKSNCFMTSSAVENPAPILIYNNLKDTSHEIARYLNQDRLTQMKFYGITGTNGKSTCVKLLKDLLNILNPTEKSASLGTLGLSIDENTYKTYNTTPFPLDLHYSIRQAYQLGAKYLTMEVSSHSLCEKRIEGVQFERIAFTNLSHDHLDFHGSMEKYLEAKMMLLNYSDKAPIFNLDCPEFSPMIEKLQDSFTFSIGNHKANLYAFIQEQNEEGINAIIHFNQNEYSIDYKLYGEHNLSNLMCVISILICEGFKIQDIVQAIPKFKAPVGRLERVPAKLGHIFIDYAHTPDALSQTLQTMKYHFPASDTRVLFGCGGNRDKEKRAQMATIAEEYSTKVYITSDNPRSEDPEQILQDIEEGFKQKSKIIKIENREVAINKAINEMDENTLLVIAGKGHEDWQEINGQTFYFSDHKICQQNYIKK